MASYTVTIFKSVKDVKTPYYVDIQLIIDRIKNGKNAEKINKIRSFVEKTDEYKKLKSSLPAICFSGKFSNRSDAGLIKHSGLVAIDFDHLGSKYNEFRKRIENDPYTFILFQSPSGDGLKLIVKIPPSVITHAQSCYAITDYYREDKLDEFKDLSRVCFESYDPDIFVNWDSLVFEQLKDRDIKQKKIIPESEYIYDFDEIYKNIKIWLDKKGEHYNDGNKHKFLVKLAAACLRFNIPFSVCENKLIFEFCSYPGCDAVAPDDINKIVSSVYKNYVHTCGTAHFDKHGEPKMNADNVKFDLKDIDITIPLKDVIYLDAVRDEMEKNYHSGLNIGETTHYKISIDNHFRLKRGELTLFHGIGNHGKSTMLMSLLVLKSMKDGYKWAIFSPEQNPPSDFYDDLVHMYIGKNTLPSYENQMKIDEFRSGMDFIKEHFFYIYPESDSPTPDYINSRFMEVIKKHNVDGCVIDPYNQLDNDISKTGYREDQYLSAFLTKQKRFAQQLNIFMFIIAHPKGTITKQADGNYSMPDVYDLAGGAMWNNKIDNIICIHRPFASTNKPDRTTYFESQKIKKRKLCGDPGRVILQYNSQTMRYTAKGYSVTRNKNGDEVSKGEVDENPWGDNKTNNNLWDDFDFTNPKNEIPF